MVANNEVKKMEVDGPAVTIITRDEPERTLVTKKETEDSMITTLANLGVSPEKIQAVDIQVKDTTAWGMVGSILLQTLLPVLLLVGLLWFMSRQIQNQNNRAMFFGSSSAREVRPEDPRQKTTFQDVAGAREAKIELEEVVSFLKNPKKFLSLGARIPKGVLLIGPPGTGKTLIARAVAGEADVPFFHISGSEFVEMFVGVGASRVRDLFARAKKASPCIVFIDEIDAVGRQRGSGLGGSHDEREQTLNQILVEMDGFDNQTNVIVIAATNRPDVLDPALLRPGRFDRRVVIHLPDLKERLEILNVHARGKPFLKEVEFKQVAQRTTGFSGADLSNLLNESAILAARLNQKHINMKNVMESIEKVLLGPERKAHVMSEHERKLTAFHEAGHALVAHVLPHADPVHKVSIISRGRAGGYTLKVPEQDRSYHTKLEFLDDLAVMMGGMASEELVFDEATTGPSNDLHAATDLARKLVTEFGMSSALGPRTFGQKEEMVFLGREIHEQRDYSDATAKRIDDEVSNFLKESYDRAKSILEKYRKYLDNIAAALLKKETLEKEEFEKLFAGTELEKPATPEDSEDVLKEKPVVSAADAPATV
ncbi:MAG: ATP-dependent zinc metalloprotease FtsH [Candidatus Kerfeldbacteria bacterium]|nr:ATP-dependent zinc metalloprotease FtsH [Candidatus Kerfeldbacteria bacterium]